jgi:hypothetical protein
VQSISKHGYQAACLYPRTLNTLHKCHLQTKGTIKWLLSVQETRTQVGLRCRTFHNTNSAITRRDQGNIPKVRTAMITNTQPARYHQNRIYRWLSHALLIETSPAHAHQTVSLRFALRQKCAPLQSSNLLYRHKWKQLQLRRAFANLKPKVHRCAWMQGTMSGTLCDRMLFPRDCGIQ